MHGKEGNRQRKTRIENHLGMKVSILLTEKRGEKRLASVLIVACFRLETEANKARRRNQGKEKEEWLK